MWQLDTQNTFLYSTIFVGSYQGPLFLGHIVLYTQIQRAFTVFASLDRATFTYRRGTFDSFNQYVNCM